MILGRKDKIEDSGKHGRSRSELWFDTAEWPGKQWRYGSLRLVHELIFDISFSVVDFIYFSFNVPSAVSLVSLS